MEPQEQIQPAVSPQPIQVPADQLDVKNWDDLQDDKITYGSTSQQLLAGVEGLARGVISKPITTALETKTGLTTPEAIEARERVNPITAGVSETVGLLAPAVATLGATGLAKLGVTGAAKAIPAIKAAAKFTQAGALESLATHATQALGIAGEAPNFLAKIGSAAAKGAIENVGFQSLDELDKQILHPDFSADAASSAIAHLGLAGLVGGTLGGAFGALGKKIKPEEAAKAVDETHGYLNAVKRKAGGIEGEIQEPIQNALNLLNIKASPEMVGLLTDNAAIRNDALTLLQSDTTASGREFQEAAKKFKSSLSDSMAQAMGKAPHEIPETWDLHGAGTKVGESLVNEYQAKIAPSIETLKKGAAIVGDLDLGPSIAGRAAENAKLSLQLQKDLDEQLSKKFLAQTPEELGPINSKIEALQQSLTEANAAAKTPGLIDVASQKIGNLVETNSWLGHDDIMAEVNRVMKRLPELKTLKDLQQEITRIGNKTASTMPFGVATPLSRAGQIMKTVLRDIEGTAIAKGLGEKEGVEMMNAYNAARQDFARVAGIKDQLDSRLGIKGSITNYAKNLKAMVAHDAEGLWRKLDKPNDVDLLNILQQEFPEAAQTFKEEQINRILTQAKSKAVEGEVLNAKVVSNAIDKLSKTSPAFKDFVFSPEMQSKIQAANQVIEKITDKSYNYSNTARTLDKLMGNIPGAAIGLVTSLASHSPVAGLLIGGLTKTLGKDIPDAARLGLLKFLGSNKEISGEGFHVMMNFIEAAQKGQKALKSGAEEVFKAGGKVIPTEFYRLDDSIKDHDEKFKQAARNPSSMLEATQAADHYMPEHTQAITQGMGQAVSYLDSIRPQPIKMGPLDPEVPPPHAERIEYQRAVQIANQPLSIYDHIANGTLMPNQVKHLATMYPDLYRKMQHELMSGMTNHLTKGGKVPYKTQAAMSLFNMTPMSATFTPGILQSLQAQYAPQPQAQAPQPEGQLPAKGHSAANKLSKMPASLATSSQARELRSQKL